jgi:hypothetical protein
MLWCRFDRAIAFISVRCAFIQHIGIASPSRRFDGGTRDGLIAAKTIDPALDG